MKSIQETILVAGTPGVEGKSKPLCTAGAMEGWHSAGTCANVDT